MSTISKIYSNKDDIDIGKLRCWLEINLSHLKNNIESIRKIITNKLDICCVVKANGYGFGSLNISKYLTSIGIKFLAVSTLEEALEIRKSGIVSVEIIILNWTPVSEKETLIKNNLTQTLIDYEYAKDLNEQPGIVKCHIKIDSGMNRFGLKIFDIEKI